MIYHIASSYIEDNLYNFGDKFEFYFADHEDSLLVEIISKLNNPILFSDIDSRLTFCQTKLSFVIDILIRYFVYVWFCLAVQEVASGP